MSRVLIQHTESIDFPADRVREAFGLAPIDRRTQWNEAPPPGSVSH